MKKILFTLMLMLTCQLVSAQSALSLFNSYKNEKHALYINVPRIMMSLAAGKVKGGNVQALLQQVNTARILTLDDCSKGTRKKFTKKITALVDKGYEEFTRVKDGRSNVLTLVKKGEKLIHEIVVLVTDEDDCLGVYIAGNINPEDVAAIVNMVDN